MLPGLFKKKLEKYHFPTHTESIDGTKQLTDKDIYDGKEAFAKFEKEHDYLDLERACELSWYNALVYRCHLSVDIITNDKTSDEHRQFAVETLLEDINKLGDLYWSVGCMHASCFLMAVVKYYQDKKNQLALNINHHLEELDDEDIDPYAGIILLYRELAAHFYLRAKVLHEFEPSQKLIECLLKVKVGREFPEFGFANETSADTTLLGGFSITEQIAMLDSERNEIANKTTRFKP